MPEKKGGDALLLHDPYTDGNGPHTRSNWDVGVSWVIGRMKSKSSRAERRCRTRRFALKLHTYFDEIERMCSTSSNNRSNASFNKPFHPHNNQDLFQIIFFF